MRVAMIVPVRPPGPLDLAESLELAWPSVEHARALGRAGVETHLFMHGAAPASESIGKQSTLHLVPGRLPQGTLHLVAAAKAIAPDLIHVFHFLARGTLSAAVLGPVPATAEYNGGSPPRNPLAKRWLRAATSRLRAVFFTAREIAEPFLASGALHPTPEVLELPEISSRLPRVADRSAAKRAANLRGAPAVLAVARAEAPKDPMILLAAFRVIAEARPDAHFTWATWGGAELESVRRRVAEDPVLRDRVELRVDYPGAQMPDLYAGADVLLHASRREVCGTAFVEALGAGLPISCTDIPAFAALAAPGAVRLSPIGDAFGLARGALALADDPGARGRAEAHFGAALSFDAIATRRLAAFRRALAR